MRKQVWVVRIAQPHGGTKSLPGFRIEQLRYLGVLKVIKSWDHSDDGMECFELSGSGTQVWADMNAARMKSFGINAVAAPRSWQGDRSSPALRSNVRTLPDAPKLTAELENEARTILEACFPAQWSSHMLSAWVGEVDQLRAQVKRLEAELSWQAAKYRSLIREESPEKS